MIEMDKVDLESKYFEIAIVDCDCRLDFPGYSLQRIRDPDDVVRLAKN
jgi:hypothetical protein